MSDGKLLDKSNLPEFIFAGNATFTVKNTESGNRFTFKLKMVSAEDSFNGQPLWFVSVLTGSDNESSYSFIGTCFSQDSFKLSRKSRISEDATSVKVWNWFLGGVTAGWISVKEQIEVWHEGRCGRCGRKLTVPESIASGFGPECTKLMAC